MNPYTWTLISLIVALLTQSLAAGWSIELYLRKDLLRPSRRIWLAFALGTLVLALQHGYSLELAMRTGLYDMRQAVMAGLVGVLFALGVYGLRRQQS